MSFHRLVEIWQIITQRKIRQNSERWSKIPGLDLGIGLANPNPIPNPNHLCTFSFSFDLLYMQ